MVKTLKTLLITACIAVIASSAAGCASLQYNHYYNTYLEQQTASYRYHTDFNFIWHEAHMLLIREGYAVSRGSGLQFETDWITLSSGDKSRYIVTGYVFGSGESTVHFDNIRILRMSEQQTVTRDDDLERKLIRIVEPNRYDEMIRGASNYADSRSAQDAAKDK